MKTSFHFYLEILTENNDKGDQRETGESEQNDERPTGFFAIKMQSDQRADNGDKNKNDEGEHIVLLCFHIGKEKHDAVCQTHKANNGNDKQSKAIVDQQNIHRRQQNTAPKHNLNGLADAVELDKVRGEDHLPHNLQGENDKNTPKRTANAKIGNEGCQSNAQKGPSHDLQHSFSIGRYLGDLGIGIFNVHSIDSLPPLLQFRHW